MSHEIAADWCGQEQPHAPHIWENNRANPTGLRQCAGYLGAGDESATYEVYNAENTLTKIRELHTHQPVGWRGRMECPEASVLPCKTCAVLAEYGRRSWDAETTGEQA